MEYLWIKSTRREWLCYIYLMTRLLLDIARTRPVSKELYNELLVKTARLIEENERLTSQKHFREILEDPKKIKLVMEQYEAAVNENVELQKENDILHRMIEELRS